MTDCDSPKCHERMVTELNGRVPWAYYDRLKQEVDSKLPKTWLKWLWIVFVVIGLPIIISALGVWSGQQSDAFKYAHKDLVMENQIRLTRLEEFRVTIRRDIDAIKCNQNEMLKILRKEYSKDGK